MGTAAKIGPGVGKGADTAGTSACATCGILILLLAPLLHAEIIDRIAVSVGNRVITVSDLDREIRVTAFQNGVKPDFSPAARRATAERMVDQMLIRREVETSRYPAPSPTEVDAGLQQWKKQHFKDEADYRRALTEYGITDEDFRTQLLWERTIYFFTETRFRPGIQVTDEEIQDYFEKTFKPAAEAAHPGAPVSLEDNRETIENAVAEPRVAEAVNTWLENARRRTEVVFHDEVFQ